MPPLCCSLTEGLISYLVVISISPAASRPVSSLLVMRVCARIYIGVWGLLWPCFCLAYSKQTPALLETDAGLTRNMTAALLETEFQIPSIGNPYSAGWEKVFQVRPPSVSSRAGVLFRVGTILKKVRTSLVLKKSRLISHFFNNHRMGIVCAWGAPPTFEGSWLQS